ncbi:hypothetical protein P9112_007382 [Eukaryota sp. TZLM1-RC]
MSVISSVRQPGGLKEIPVQMKINKIIERLKEDRRPHTLQELSHLCHIDFTNDEKLQAALSQNPKIAFDGEGYRFQPSYPCSDKQSLLAILNEHPFGISMDELKESYEEVEHDVEELKFENLLSEVSTKGKRPNVVFPTYGNMGVSVSDDVLDMWEEVEVPELETTLESKLLELGEKPLLLVEIDQDAGESRRSSASQRGRKKKKVVTQNVHLE